MILAHGIGGVQGLPLDGELVLQTGGVVVLLSFLAVALLWRRSRFTGPVDGRALPAVPRWVAPAAQTVVFALALYVIGVGLFGPQDPDANPAPRALYVLLWVGVVALSLVFGPVWRAVNPLRVAAAAVRAVLRTEPVALPERLGYWPASVWLLLFVWLELVPADRDGPALVAGALLGYAVAQVAAGVRYGPGWFARGDAFEVYSTLTATLSAFGRLADGRVGVRNPFRALAAVAVEPGLVAFLAVWWGSTVFDGLSGWAGWRSLGLPAALDTALLVAVALLVGVLYRLATGRLAGLLASTLVPIAVGYTIAHYATLLLVEGPRGVAQLFGAELGAVTAVPAPGAVAAVQIGAVLVGHVVAVVAAHDRSVALLPEQRRLADQVPLVLLMVAYTMAGLFLLVIA